MYNINDYLRDTVHPMRADTIIKSIELLNSLEYTVIQDQMNNIVMDADNHETTANLEEIDTAIKTGLKYACNQHGIVFMEGITLSIDLLYGLLSGLVAIPNVDDLQLVVGELEHSSEDDIFTLGNIVENLRIESFSMDEYLESVSSIHPATISVIKELMEGKIDLVKLADMNERPNNEYIQQRLLLYPDERREKSEMWAILDAGLPLGYDVTESNLLLLRNVLSNIPENDHTQILEECRVFLLGSSVGDSNLVERMGELVEELDLPSAILLHMTSFS